MGKIGLPSDERFVSFYHAFEFGKKMRGKSRFFLSLNDKQYFAPYRGDELIARKTTLIGPVRARMDAIKRSRQWVGKVGWRDALKYEARRYYRLRSRD